MSQSAFSCEVDWYLESLTISWDLVNDLLTDIVGVKSQESAGEKVWLQPNLQLKGRKEELDKKGPHCIPGSGRLFWVGNKSDLYQHQKFTSCCCVEGVYQLSNPNS